jgi:glycosyltransferase involved in cell wall biosynthesis
VRGLIVGGGPERERLRKLAEEDGVVQVLGERSDVPDIVKAADTACLSSSAEGVPMVLLEAMALGKPIVATDVGGVADAVEHEKTGLLVPSADDEAFASALLRLASDRALAERLGHAARERHRSLFSVERMIADYARVLQEVIESARPADGRNVSVAQRPPTGRRIAR